MSFLERIPDEETVELTTKRINYFSQVPKHVKGMVSELKNIQPLAQTEDNGQNPVPLVEGNTTVYLSKQRIFKKLFLTNP